jgi:hypothetical protein
MGKCNMRKEALPSGEPLAVIARANHLATPKAATKVPQVGRQTNLADVRLAMGVAST